eukprot:m.292626 g.292626  ORF g.292626 m.292626 type:complete len:282 (-) comp27126_c0_seq1:531-1376(-)
MGLTLWWVGRCHSPLSRNLRVCTHTRDSGTPDGADTQRIKVEEPQAPLFSSALFDSPSGTTSIHQESKNTNPNHLSNRFGKMPGAVLTADTVLTSARATLLDEVVNFNCWGMELADLSILDRLPLVEVLSLSINNIDTLRYFSKCTALRELYLRRNQVPSLSELAHLTGLENLRVLWLSHNPVADDPLYRATVIRTLPLLQKLDDTDVTDEERAEAATKGREISALTEDDDGGGDDGQDDEDGDETQQAILRAVLSLLPTLSPASLTAVIETAASLQQDLD